MSTTPQTTPTNWAQSKAPSLADFEQIAEVAFAALPAQFRPLCDGVVIKIDDFPDEETLSVMQCESEFELLGLFRGQGLAHAEAVLSTGVLPNMVWLYRRPLLDYWAEHDETLGALISHVLIHEIGHHFGLSDEDMEALEAEAG